MKNMNQLLSMDRIFIRLEIISQKVKSYLNLLLVLIRVKVNQLTLIIKMNGVRF